MTEPAVVHRTPRVPPRQDQWWRGAVIYQIYPRSFADSNGDGVGDLPGITSHLEHVARLGADAVWISPFFKSPMKDFGYDVADYRAVDPIFGSIEDFDLLIERAHALGLKVLIDFVPSHTSNEHPWFLESRASRNNPKADWYVWADAAPDGMPPNNWISIFGGVAWEWEPRRGQYYLHNFLKEQPDLNFHNPEVIAALLDQARFWLERGVDGLRIDAIEFGVHDQELRNNPPRPPGARVAGAAMGSPYSMQIQRHNKARPELNDLFLKPLHRLSAGFGATALLGEITGDRALERIAGHTDGGGLDMAYGFDLLTCPLTAEGIRSVVERMEQHIGDGWICWSFCNHDVVRAVRRLDEADPPEAARQMLPVLLGSLRGTVCLYQGEELGLDEADLAFEDLQDPFGITFWPSIKGRDGCRTPMPWDDRLPQAGFTTGKPWLPLPPAQVERAVRRQAGAAGSTLEHVRRFLGWRRGQPALREGTIAFLETPEPILAFERALPGQRLLCLFNMGPSPQRLATSRRLTDAGFPADGVRVEPSEVVMPGYAAAFFRVDEEG